MNQSFHNYKTKQQNKLTNISNLYSFDNNLKNNFISFSNLLELNLKGLNIYNNNLNSYISKLSNKDLILKLKQDLLPNLIVSFNSLENKLDDNNENIKLLKQKEKNINNNIDIKNKQSKNEYLNIIKINNYNYKYNTLNYIQYIDYKYNSINNKFIKKIYDFLFYSFLSMNSLISKPIFENFNDKLVIHLFFYLHKKSNKNNNFISLNNIKLNIICKILSKMFNKPVELDLIRLHYPYFDSNIFVNLLSILINKIQIRIIMQKFFKNAIIKDPIKLSKDNLIFKIPSFLSGIKLRIGGRLMTHRLVPKQTVKIFRKGTLSKGKINFLDEARYTNKNKRGAFTITISIGHYLN